MLRRGDYVSCNFPFRESDGPGPSPHVVLCAATGREGNVNFAIVFYTTSQTDYQGARRLPLTRDYFPEMVDQNVRVIGRDPILVAKVEQRLRELIAAGFRIGQVDAVQDRQSPPR